MSAFKTIKRVHLGPHHLRPGKTHHWISDARGQRDFPQFVSLEIATPTSPAGTGYFLLHISETGEVADTWHQSIADAMHQAAFEFGIREEEWIEL